MLHVRLLSHLKVIYYVKHYNCDMLAAIVHAYTHASYVLYSKKLSNFQLRNITNVYVNV